MKDKEIIRAEIERLQDGLMDAQGRFCTNAAESAYHILCHLENFINSMQEEPVSEDMWEASKQYALRQVFASTDAIMTEQAYLSLQLFNGFEIAVAHKDGANWQKQQMMEDAVEVEVWDEKPPHITYFPENLKGGDKVKLIIIKEDEQ